MNTYVDARSTGGDGSTPALTGRRAAHRTLRQALTPVRGTHVDAAAGHGPFIVLIAEAARKDSVRHG